jgi:hypothetical protein
MGLLYLLTFTHLIRDLAGRRAGIESGEEKVLCHSLESTETSVIHTEDQPIYRLSNPRSLDINKYVYSCPSIIITLCISDSLRERSACAAEGYGLSLIIHGNIQSGLYFWQAPRTIKHGDRKEMQTVGEKCSVAAAVEFSRVASLSCDTDTKAMKTSAII